MDGKRPSLFPGWKLWRSGAERAAPSAKRVAVRGGVEKWGGVRRRGRRGRRRRGRSALYEGAEVACGTGWDRARVFDRGGGRLYVDACARGARREWGGAGQERGGRDESAGGGGARM